MRPQDRGQNPKLSREEKKYVRQDEEKIWAYHKKHYSMKFSAGNGDPPESS